MAQRRIYVIFCHSIGMEDRTIYRCYLDSDLRDREFEQFIKADTEQECSWSTSSYPITE